MDIKRYLKQANEATVTKLKERSVILKTETEKQKRSNNQITIAFFDGQVQGIEYALSLLEEKEQTT